MKNKVYKYKLIQDDICVASVECEDREFAQKEINYYALIYSHDGPVKIVFEVK